MRRRLAVTATVLALLAGEWLGHSLSYLRVAGLAGLRAGLTGGIHDYMIPLGLALLVAGAAGAAIWGRAWMAIGRRFDRSAAALRRLRRGQRVGAAGCEPGPALGGQAGAPERVPSLGARVLALAALMALLQCSLFVLQENLERVVHGLASGGFAPLLDGYGAGAAIQGCVALLLATVLVAAMGLLRARSAAAVLCERIVRALWQRALRSTSSPQPPQSDVIPAQLVLRTALWSRPPPVPAAA
ncbi:MAG: hypothetical protein M3019_07670 [Candidatus Dormibacteraeota bacterium]|nr:hypothetical protein [Candidatus Dormibacteraeota bacterium]